MKKQQCMKKQLGLMAGILFKGVKKLTIETRKGLLLSRNIFCITLIEHYRFALVMYNRSFPKDTFFIAFKHNIILVQHTNTYSWNNAE